MMAVLARAELFVLAAVAFALLSSAVCSLLVPGVLARVQGWEPWRRHTVVLGLSLAPAALTGLLLLSALAPTLLSLIDASFDHCVGHDDHHAHLCFFHGPHHAAHVWIWACLAAVVTWVGAQLVVRLVDVLRASARARVLVRTGERAAEPALTIIDANRPYCATVGLLAPRVLASRSLLDALAPVQRAALIAHEASHVRRRDALVRLCAGMMSALYPPRHRRALARALEVAAEQASDEEAARVVGDRLVVAETILCVERALSQSAEAPLGLVAVGIHQAAVAQRVEALLAAPQVGGSLVGVLGAVGVSVAGLAAASGWLHHAVESWLSRLLH